MPQSSLLGWLNKPSTVPPPPRAKVREARSTIGDVRDATTPLSVEQVEATTLKHLSGSLSGPEASPGTTRSNFHYLVPNNVELRSCTKADIKDLKLLNSLLLCIPYPESFYREIIEDQLTNNITLLACWHDDPSSAGRESGRLIGAVRARLLGQSPATKSSSSSSDQAKRGPMLYLSTLVLLSPYRSQGIAVHLLDVLTRRAVRDYGVTSIGAHVWEANAEGLEWYRRRGFREVAHEKGYYRRLQPQGAVVVQRDIGIMDLVER